VSNAWRSSAARFLQRRSILGEPVPRPGICACHLSLAAARLTGSLWADMTEPGFSFRPFTRCDAEAIVSWRYPAPYDIYNLDASPPDEEVESLLRSELHYFAVLNEEEEEEEEEMVAFRCFGLDAQVPGGNYEEDALDMGGGLRPDLTGRGLGRSVIEAAMSFAIRKFHPRRFRTTIASFNARAKHVCEALGYVGQSEFVRPRDQRRFVVLTREIDMSNERRSKLPQPDRPDHVG
jgi:ribosomal-protein-alanine N-acetyltransferase